MEKTWKNAACKIPDIYRPNFAKQICHDLTIASASTSNMRIDWHWLIYEINSEIEPIKTENQFQDIPDGVPP